MFNKLLISTIHKFVLWDEKPYTLHKDNLFENVAHYTGITWNEDNIFVSDRIDTKYFIHIFDKSFNLVDILDNTNLHAVHQIYWYNNKLYVVNTDLNRIEILDNNKWSHFTWNKSTCDTDHINSIWCNNSNFYVAEFRQYNGPESRIRICDNNLNCSEEILVGSGIHNVYVENSVIYTLMSRPPQVVRIGLDAIPLINAEEGFIRGLARTKDYWYIGITRWEPEREKRDVGNATILQLDNNFNEVNRIIMHDFGPVYDIRVIDELDLAHNGIDF